MRALSSLTLPDPDRREVVLVGAGHAHVQVLRACAMAPLAGARLTLVVDTPLAVYSGMVPGFVAGQYQAHELEIDAVPLARRAGARVILSAAVGVDPVARRILLADRPPVPYDLASFDVGSTVAGLELPGIRALALPTRPIARFVERLAAVEAAVRASQGPFRVLVVGGGAAGVELAFTFEARLAAVRPGVTVTLVHSGPRLLAGYPAKLAERVRQACERRGIVVRAGRTVTGAEGEPPSFLARLDDGSALPCEALVWAAGAVSHPVWDGSGLPLEARGFVLTRPTLQVVGHDELFAVGDCATLADFPTTPKAGVYAVRQGPFLLRNLRAALNGRPLEAYRPQRDFLTLLNLGDGTAVGAKWGQVFEGPWVMGWKDRIDRRFMERFQLLAPDGAPGPAVATLPTMAEAMPMVCGGCAAKLAQDGLERALARLGPGLDAPEVVLGLAAADDAVAFRTPRGEVLVGSVDFFRAFTDDPYLVGRVAATNALSDLEAKGLSPRWAQALVALPLDAAEREAEELLFQVLAGARAVLDARGVVLLGGHTSRAAELLVGFAVEGVAPDEDALRPRRGALEAGQVLLLTRPLGTGVLFHADMAGLARGPWVASAQAAAVVGNAGAAPLLGELGVAASTDVTGFGLAGHLASMLAGSGLSARLELARLPVLPGALELLARGERSSFHEENARLRRTIATDARTAASARYELLFDPQTAGGLLLALPAPRAAVALAALHVAGYPAAARIGEVVPGRADGAAIEVS